MDRAEDESGTVYRRQRAKSKEQRVKQNQILVASNGSLDGLLSSMALTPSNAQSSMQIALARLASAYRC